MKKTKRGIQRRGERKCEMVKIRLGLREGKRTNGPLFLEMVML